MQYFSCDKKISNNFVYLFIFISYKNEISLYNVVNKISRKSIENKCRIIRIFYKRIIGFT